MSTKYNINNKERHQREFLTIQMRTGVWVHELKCLLPNDVSLANLNLSGSVNKISERLMSAFILDIIYIFLNTMQL